MDCAQFNTMVDEQLEYCREILQCKGMGYSSQKDRLHNFKQAAALQQITPRQALTGMMAKHTVSLYDMCSTSNKYPDAVWLEKITDSINYLLLLKGLLADERTDEQGVLFDSKGHPILGRPDVTKLLDTKDIR